MTKPVSTADLLERMREIIRTADISDSPMMEAQWILEKVSGWHRPDMLTHPERLLSGEQAAEATALTERYAAGEPLPYLLGNWHFYGNRFKVTPNVLIPRPETELLVDLAADWLQAHPDARHIFDIGTGSGCIAISLMKSKKLHLKTICATDLSLEALMIAQENAAANGLKDRIQLVQADLSVPFEVKFDLICANLPYIPTERLGVLEVSRHEPLSALDGGPDGFLFYRRLLQDLSGKMAANALILCEIDFSQENQSIQTAHHSFPAADCSVIRDYSGLPRILSVKFGA